jgi:hypothetical protein
MKVLPGVILLYGNLVYKVIFLGSIHNNHFYIGPFYCSQTFTDMTFVCWQVGAPNIRLP